MEAAGRAHSLCLLLQPRDHRGTAKLDGMKAIRPLGDMNSIVSERVVS